MFNISVDLTSGDSQILRSLVPAAHERELILLNYGFEPVSGDPVLKLHGFKSGDPAFPIVAHGVTAGDNFDTGQDSTPHDAYMGGLRIGPERALAASVVGAGKTRITLWGYTVFHNGKQFWNDKGDAPEA
jgi:hypothetical protein